MRHFFTAWQILQLAFKPTFFFFLPHQGIEVSEKQIKVQFEGLSIPPVRGGCFGCLQPENRKWSVAELGAVHGADKVDISECVCACVCGTRMYSKLQKVLLETRFCSNNSDPFYNKMLWWDLAICDYISFPHTHCLLFYLRFYSFTVLFLFDIWLICFFL